ncbi:hypothetical protein ACYU03_10335 [Pseudomonas sp. X10]
MIRSMPATALALACTLGTPQVLAQQPPSPCPDGWLSIRARVNQLTPTNARLSIDRASSQTHAPVTVGSVLCEGDTLLFEPGQENTQVELFEAGRLFIWEGQRGPYSVPSGTKARLNAVAAYLNAAFAGANDLGPTLQRANPTHGRGGGASNNEVMRAITPLRDLPRQALVIGTRTVTGWHNGSGPWRCNWLDSDSQVLLRGEAIHAAHCRTSPAPANVAALETEDAQGATLIWPVEEVSATALPRPEWVPPGTPVLDAETRAAWAVWLWREGGAAWRLQAVAMLNETRDVWLAGWLLAGILAENPQVVPK